MKLLLLLFPISFFNYCNAQDTAYARKVINDLCSDKFKGRGYVGNGDAKAAKYIKNEFVKIGLKPFENNFYQKFPFSINTFPKTVEVKYNGVILKPGIDYIVDASSASVDFKGEISFVSFDELNNESHYDSKGYGLKTAILDTFTPKYAEEAAITLKKYISDRKKHLIIRLSNEKLTWSSSSIVTNYGGITIRSEIFDRSKPANFEIKVKNKFHQPYTSQNVIGMIEGTQNKDSFIFFTAHYDHLGMMGKSAIFPGANDNASGIAMMLNLAKYFKDNPQKYSLVFIAFSAEETGLIGSRYFVDHPLVPLDKIHFLINIDLMGNGAEGVMAVNGAIFKEEFSVLKGINDKFKYLPEIKVRGKAANSDHYWFSENGVHCFFFYLMGKYPHYHDINDKSSAVPLTNFSNAFELFRDFIVHLQKN